MVKESTIVAIAALGLGFIVLRGASRTLEGFSEAANQMAAVPGDILAIPGQVFGGIPVLPDVGAAAAGLTDWITPLGTAAGTQQLVWNPAPLSEFTGFHAPNFSAIDGGEYYVGAPGALI